MNDKVLLYTRFLPLTWVKFAYLPGRYIFRTSYFNNCVCHLLGSLSPRTTGTYVQKHLPFGLNDTQQPAYMKHWISPFHRLETAGIPCLGGLTT